MQETWQVESRPCSLPVQTARLLEGQRETARRRMNHHLLFTAQETTCNTGLRGRSTRSHSKEGPQTPREGPKSWNTQLRARGPGAPLDFL